MAQRFFIKNNISNFKFEIEDNELCIDEFQELFENIKKKLNIRIDSYSGSIIKLSKNRILAQILTKQIYEIEENFPISRKSKFDKKVIISKVVVLRFFNIFLNVLNEAERLKSDIIIDGE